jgi:hypothetical protein
VLKQLLAAAAGGGQAGGTMADLASLPNGDAGAGSHDDDEDMPPQPVVEQDPAKRYSRVGCSSTLGW